VPPGPERAGDTGQRLDHNPHLPALTYASQACSIARNSQRQVISVAGNVAHVEIPAIHAEFDGLRAAWRPAPALMTDRAASVA
jgi:hypothetical protein